MDLFDQAAALIKAIAEVCPETADQLMAAMKGLQRVSCTADAAGKSDAFDAASAAIDQAYVDCPKQQKNIDELRALLNQGMTVKCCGGG